MSNHLIHENSPYLLQHADNPVDWYPWGPEALEKARGEDKPIFLSIGYAACHWCHVMAHESFEDPDTADLMNRYFVNIKVDREERPDLDGIYMQAVVAITGQGGWPMSTFLTPDGKPFYGGTYFPPVRRYNMPAFGEVLLTIARLWQEDRPRLLESSQQIAQALQAQAAAPQAGEQSAGLRAERLTQTLERAGAALAQGYDRQHGGWGGAPKFPQPMTIEFLLRRSTRRSPGGDRSERDLAVHALQAMMRGGMYDVVGGGFARYSTDNEWRVPHFEKMLYDNAQLALAYLHGWLILREEASGSDEDSEAARLAAAFRRVCQETLDFTLREMTHPLGGFYSSLDADSEGEEGKYYVWTPQEIREALGNETDTAFALAAYGVTETGNFEGKNVLQRALSDEQLADRFGLPVTGVQERLNAIHARLLEARQARIRPGTDDKILTGWNALMLVALAEAGRYLGRPDYLQAARKNARFLLGNLVVEGRLMRSWREPHLEVPHPEEPHPDPLQKKNAFGEGEPRRLASLQLKGASGEGESHPLPPLQMKNVSGEGEPHHLASLQVKGASGEGSARHYGYLEDYAALILGLLALYQGDPDAAWYAAAVELAGEMVAHFNDPEGGFFDTRDEAETLLLRPKDLQDNATPSGSALACCALLQLAAYGENPAWRDRAEGMLAALQELMGRYPTAFAQWLQAADFALGPVAEVAIVGDPVQAQTAALREALWGRYRPRQVAALADLPLAPGSPPLLNDRPLKDGLPTAYVCRGLVCQQPVNDAAQLVAQLNEVE